MKMRVRAIDFVEVRVSDMDRTLRFYRETLGNDAAVEELRSKGVPILSKDGTAG
jgi:predicted enzyme related to lactoylglutathione lyase